ncbi:MAG: toxin-antitoxin system HicB family antitoxin [Pegethrix bostrychoides GSE-TBD4-15B]|jgi:predicted HicB family RNase H-like nuclease|uniref:Toxin-antitoxin system HicB family antitoxin n=1 Tax=Pegethrix bostrychoides GSE-TBD4-15B TaxID=2839662 RepID=A0A951U5D9_9CYAN|nr:toxin-antitoxin system HicB family antitoxin [Pegethrix bostrychoides GSE-TBD4-15B]
MTDDQMSFSGQPVGWPGLGQNTGRTGQPAKRRREPTTPREPIQEPKVYGINQRSKVALKQLSLRIDEGTHAKISQAAQKADKSINAWMEEVLSMAADDTLGSEGEGVIDSAAIRHLIEDPGYARRLIELIEPNLQDSSFAAIFQFSHPLRKLLVGWDRIKPLLPPSGLLADLPTASGLDPDSDSAPDSAIVKLTDAILPCLPAINAVDAVAVIQFNTALKKFLLGLAAVMPFMKADRNHSLLAVVKVVEQLVHEIETGAAR